MIIFHIFLALDSSWPLLSSFWIGAHVVGLKLCFCSEPDPGALPSPAGPSLAAARGFSSSFLKFRYFSCTCLFGSWLVYKGVVCPMGQRFFLWLSVTDVCSDSTVLGRRALRFQPIECVTWTAVCASRWPGPQFAHRSDQKEGIFRHCRARGSKNISSVLPAGRASWLCTSFLSFPLQVLSLRWGGRWSPHVSFGCGYLYLFLALSDSASFVLKPCCLASACFGLYVYILGGWTLPSFCKVPSWPWWFLRPAVHFVSY